MKNATVKKLSQKDMHSATMDTRVFMALNNIARAYTVTPHGQDGFTVKHGRRKLFEIYVVPTGYTMWVTDTLSVSVDMPVAPSRRNGANTEYLLTLAQVLDVMTQLVW